MAAGPHEATSKVLGSCGCAVAKRENLLEPGRFEFLWVVDFPMFDWLEDEERWWFMHHPFTAPLESDADCSRPIRASVRARAYDLVLNGSEIGGGSIRIHDQRMQRQVFKLLGMSDEEARRGSASSWTRSSTARRRTAGSRSASTASWRSWRASVDPRGDRVPEDRAGGGSDGRRAVRSRSAPAQGPAHQDCTCRSMRQVARRARIEPLTADLRHAQGSDPRRGR